jgi:hypothetical protein
MREILTHRFHNNLRPRHMDGPVSVTPRLCCSALRMILHRNTPLENRHARNGETNMADQDNPINLAPLFVRMHACALKPSGQFPKDQPNKQPQQQSTQEPNTEYLFLGHRPGRNR